jgi:orotate phosphoribosyltransferase
MDSKKSEFIAFLVESQAVQFGEFTLKSGEKSPFFVDLGCVRTGKGLEYLGRSLASGLHERFPEVTLLFGPAYKGIALATAAAIGCWTALGRNVPVLYNRKEQKGHGEKGLYIGQAPTAADRVIIVDDVLSSGGTKLEAAQAIQEAFGVRPEGVIVTVDRTRKNAAYDRVSLPVHALVTIGDLADYLKASNDPRAALVQRFSEGD